MNTLKELAPLIFCIAVIQNSHALCQNAERFEINADDNTVLDLKTGLLWQRCILGRYGDQCLNGETNKVSWQEANDAAANLSSAPNDSWRIPSVKELSSLVDIRCYDPSTDESVFPNTPAQHFWTKNSFAPNTSKQWTINFLYGDDGIAPKSIRLNLRLVKEPKV